MNGLFDVFLSHNSKDKPTVRQLAQALQARGLKVWLDEEQLVPGRPWQEALEAVIQTICTAAVLVGKDGLGPWEIPEMRACLSEFVNRQLPVIPVLLPDAPVKPELPLFLRAFTWVDLRGGLTEDSLNRLQWGITGVKPGENRTGSLPETVQSSVRVAAPLPATRYSGKTRFEFCRRLGDNWRHLADYLEIPNDDQARFEHGDEARAIWVWLENRTRLSELSPALAGIGREDLVEILQRN